MAVIKPSDMESRKLTEEEFGNFDELLIEWLVDQFQDQSTKEDRLHVGEGIEVAPMGGFPTENAAKNFRVKIMPEAWKLCEGWGATTGANSKRLAPVKATQVARDGKYYLHIKRVRK